MNLSIVQRLIGFLTRRELYLALGSAFAGGSQPGRIEGERHAFLAFVWASDAVAADRVFDALEQDGWTMPQIDKIKHIDMPFENREPALINAFHAALRGDVGIVVYSNTES